MHRPVSFMHGSCGPFLNTKERYLEKAYKNLIKGEKHMLHLGLAATDSLTSWLLPIKPFS